MNIVHRGNYLVDAETGRKVLFYECDPAKNKECDKKMCRAGEAESDGFGFCAKTANPAYRKDGGRAWHAVFKVPADGEPYWGREYVEGV